MKVYIIHINVQTRTNTTKVKRKRKKLKLFHRTPEFCVLTLVSYNHVYMGVYMYNVYIFVQKCTDYPQVGIV